MNNPQTHTLQLRNHPHTSHTTTMSHLPIATTNIFHHHRSGLTSGKNHQFLSSTMMSQPPHTSQRASHPQLRAISIGNHQLNHMLHMNLLQLNGPTGMNYPLFLFMNNLAALTVICIRVKLKTNHGHTPQLLNHLHTKPTTGTNHQLQHINHMSQPQLNGPHTTMNHLLKSINMNHPPTHIPLNTNHPHMFHTTSGNHQLRLTNHMSQSLFNGLITMNHLQLNSGTTSQQLTVTMLNHLHLHSTNISHTTKKQLHTNHMSQQLLNGQTTTMLQLLLFTPGSQTHNSTIKNHLHLHTKPTGTMNHLLNPTNNMNQLHLNG
jgi:hypothetical protein